MSMKVLVIADRPPKSPIREAVQNENINLIITLGDLEYTQIAELDLITNIPKIGVYGNHCTPGYMEQLGIVDMHLKTLEVDGISFGGFEGSHRYKNYHFAKMYTQDEAVELMKDFPYVDVFIAHSPPAGINDEDDPAHKGLIALRNYLDQKQPKYFFHGHTYPTPDSLVQKCNNTNVVYVTADKIVELVF